MMTAQITLPCNQLAVLGRADIRSNSLAFDWTNSGVFFKFSGDGVVFHFDAPALHQRLFVQIDIDGKRSRFCVSEESTDIRIAAEEDGIHKIHCVRINEILDAVPLVLTSIEICGEQPSLCDVSLPDRRMMFIGDSITCGFGVLTEGAGNGFTTDEQDGAHTYAALTAAHFGAQAHFICISGRGVVRNCDDAQFPLIPEFFNYTTVSNPIPWNHSQYQPDVIVVNAGTNDADGENHTTPQKFQAGVTEFLTTLRSLYPRASIIWVYGMMNDFMHPALQETIAAFGDDRVSYVKMTSVWAHENEQGACCHPNLRSHYRCAGVMIDAVSKVTGWNK